MTGRLQRSQLIQLLIGVCGIGGFGVLKVLSKNLAAEAYAYQNAITNTKALEVLTGAASNYPRDASAVELANKSGLFELWSYILLAIGLIAMLVFVTTAISNTLRSRQT